MALAFHFIFDELSTPSWSKMAAILAKSTKTEVMPGEPNFLINKTRSAMAIEECPNNVNLQKPSMNMDVLGI